jgi:hypothetical protein
MPSALTNDNIIRKAFLKFLGKKHNNDKKIRIIQEFSISDARIDIAVFNGIMHGYEIKSDVDTLKRLPQQINAYNSIFDRITLVVGKTHLYEAIKLVPDWWGIKLAKIKNNKTVFYTIRTANKNPKQNSLSIANLLWKEETLALLKKNQALKGLASKPKRILCEKLTVVCSKEELNEYLRNRIISYRYKQ